MNKHLSSRLGFSQTKIRLILWALGLALLAPAWPVLAAQTTRDSTKATVAVFHLSGPLTETPAQEDLFMFSLTGNSLQDLVARMKKAADDAAVKAVVIIPELGLFGVTQAEELRGAMALVRAKGKDVHVHADSLMTPEYVLACGASRISVVPRGMVMVPGLNASSMHLRGLLDKIGVKPDFIAEGAYKSAVELFMREQPSPEADQMMNWLMDSWYASVTDQIAQGRKVDPAKVKQWLDTGLYTTESAKEAGLIDAVEYTEDFEAMLKKRYGNHVTLDKKYGRKEPPTLDFSSPFAFFKIWMDLISGLRQKADTKPAIGIVYVDGPILTGKGQSLPFGGGSIAFSTEVRRALEKAAEDDTIKAVVLRIDSPGGSATASEIILQATKRLKARKPLVVSMGSVAGSGGYYVACAADTIFADATTLTGSIGVLAGKLVTTEMWRKIGISFKEYKRGQNAGILSSDAVFSESERARMRAFLDETYEAFKGHVQQIRGDRLKKPLEELAGGRVFTGKQALELGLVDRLGTLNDAIVYLANQVQIKDYEVRAVPEPKNFIEQLMEEVTDGKEDANRLRSLPIHGSLLELAVPYLEQLDPKRVKAVISALTRLEILRAENVVLTMPEIVITP